MSGTSRPITRRSLLRLTGGSLAALALAGCQQLAPPPPPTPSPAPRAAGPTLVLASSELVVGPNRFAVGIIGAVQQNQLSLLSARQRQRITHRFRGVWRQVSRTKNAFDIDHDFQGLIATFMTPSSRSPNKS